MPADWKTIQADPEYQALPASEQAKVTAAYLGNLMASKPDVGPTRARAAQLPADDTVSASESWADDTPATVVTPPHPNDLASRQIPANLQPQTTPGQMLNQAAHGFARGAVTMGPYGMLDTMLQGAPLADRIKAQAAPPAHAPIPRYPMDIKNPAQQRLDQANQALDLARGLTYGPIVDAYHAAQDLADSNAITPQHPMGFEGSIDGAAEALRQTLPRAIGETVGMSLGDPAMGVAHFKGAPAVKGVRDLSPHWSGIDQTGYGAPHQPAAPPEPLSARASQAEATTPDAITPPAPAPDPAGGSALAVRAPSVDDLLKAWDDARDATWKAMDTEPGGSPVLRELSRAEDEARDRYLDARRQSWVSGIPKAVIPDSPQAGPAPHEMTRAAFEATGDDLLHGTSRPIEQFDPAAPNRYNRPATNPEGRFYFTDQPAVAHTMANATGYKNVDLHRFADSNDLEPHEAMPQLLASLTKQVEAGKTLYAIDPDTGRVEPMHPSDPRVPEALLDESDVRLYPEGRAPNIIRTKVYGPTLDLTDPKNVPADLRDRLEKQGSYRPWEDELNNFNHEFTPDLIRYAREKGYGKIKVRDTYESGHRSTIGLHEYIGHGRDPHRAFVEKALAEGKHVSPEVLADYPDLAPKPAETRPQPAEVKPGTLKGLVAGEEGAFDPMAFFRKKEGPPPVPKEPAINEQLATAMSRYNEHLSAGNKDAAAMAAQHIQELQAKGAEMPKRAEPTPADAPSRRSIQGKINALEKKRAAFEAAGDHDRAGQAAARIDELRAKMDPQAKREYHTNPDDIVASDYHNFKVGDYSPEESAIRARIIRESVASMDHDPHAVQTRAEQNREAMALTWKQVEDQLRKGPLKKGETLPLAYFNRFTIESKALQQEIARIEAEQQQNIQHWSREQLHESQDHLTALEDQLRRFTDQLVPDRSEKGRALNALRYAVGNNMDAAYWVGKLRKAEGRAEPPAPNSRAAATEKKLNRTLAKGADAQTRLKDALAELDALGVTDHGLTANPKGLPGTGQRSLIGRLWDKMRTLAKAEQGSFDPHAVLDWLYGRDRNAPPVKYADPAHQAAFEKAWRAAKDEIDAKAAAAKILADAERDSVWQTASNVRKAGMVSGLKTLEKVTLSHMWQILAEGTSKTLASPFAAAMAPLTEGHGVTVIPPGPLRVLSAGAHAVVQGTVDAWHTIVHGIPKEDLARAQIHAEPHSSIPVLGPVLDAYTKAIFRAHTITYRPFYLYARRRGQQDFALTAALAEHPTNPVAAHAAYRAILADPEGTLGKAQAAVMAAEGEANGLFATFSEENAASDFINKGRKLPYGIGPALDATIPFAHIPMNIISHVLQYAWVGSVPGVSGIALSRLTGRVAGLLSRDEQRTIAMALGRGLTGSAVMYLGALLYQKQDTGLAGKLLSLLGVEGVTPTGKEDHRRLDQATGKTPDAIIHNGGHVKADFMSPVGNLLVMGATLARDGFGTQGAGEKAVSLLSVGLRTLMDGPYMSGVQALEDLKKDPVKGVGKFMGSTAGSFVPSFVNDYAASQDTVERRADKDHPIQSGIASRLPGKSFLGHPGRESLEPKIGIDGQTLPNERTGLNAINVLHGTPDRTQNSPLLATMDRLGINPPVSKGEFAMPHRGKADAVKVKLTPELDTAYQQAVGQMRDKIAGRVAADPGFQKLIEQGDDEAARTVLRAAFAKSVKAGSRVFLAQNLDALMALRKDAVKTKLEAKAKTKEDRVTAANTSSTDAQRDQLLQQSAGASF